MQLFIPTDSNNAAELLTSLGLDDLVAGVTTFQSAGPNGERGLHCVWPLPKMPPRLQAVESLTWIPAIEMRGRAAGAYHVGLPSILDARLFARQQQFPGQYLELRGTNWAIPIPSMLPASLLFGSGGELERGIQLELNGVLMDAQYALQVDQMIERLATEEDPGVDWQWLRDFALKALNINYRMLPEIANHYRLIDERSAREILYIACGVRLVSKST